VPFLCARRALIPTGRDSSDLRFKPKRNSGAGEVTGDTISEV